MIVGTASGTRIASVAVLLFLVSGCGGGSGGSDPQPLNNTPPSNTPPSTTPPFSDVDFDRIADADDNCMRVYNVSQSDVDLDRIGDVCDSTYDPTIPAPPGVDFSNIDSVIVGHFLSSDQEPPFATSIIRDVIDGTAQVPGVSQELLKFSYGAADHTYQYIADWIRLPRDSAFYDGSLQGPLQGRHQKTIDAMEAFETLGYSSAHDKYVLIFNDSQSVLGGACVGGGFGFGGGVSVGYVQLAGVGGRTCFHPTTVTHELLHAFGFSHAQASSCDGFVNGVPQNIMFPSGEPAACSISRDAPLAVGYFSEDVMGAGSSHPSAHKKAFAGWLHSDSIVRVEDSTQVELDALEYASLGAKTAMIPLSSDPPEPSQAAYWVEYRAETNQVRIWMWGVGAMLWGSEWPYGIGDYTFQSSSFLDGLQLSDGGAFHDPYRGIGIRRISSHRDGLLPKTTVEIQRSGFRSYPRAIALMRPGQQATVTFVNQGTNDITLQNATIQGRGAAHFAVLLDDCSARTLIPREQCTVTVTSLDAQSVSEIRDAVVEIGTSDELRPKANHSIRVIPNQYPDPPQ